MTKRTSNHVPERKPTEYWLAEARLIIEGETWIKPRREHLLALMHDFERRETKRAVLSLGLNGNFP